MELLGTKNGSTPGPTAAKAEAAYNAQLAAQKEKVRIVMLCFQSKSKAFPVVYSGLYGTLVLHAFYVRILHGKKVNTVFLS